MYMYAWYIGIYMPAYISMYTYMCVVCTCICMHYV